jgi:uncharacterized protein (TIGR02145 family)
MRINFFFKPLILSQLFLFSCSNEPSKDSEIANNKEDGISLVNSIIQITGQDFNEGSSSSGFVKGEAVMKIIPSESEIKVIVKYRYLMSSGIQEATERGHLENFVITDDGVNNTRIIRADWINQDAGNGTFVLKSYSEDDPKTIIAQINAKGDGNWYHSTRVELTDEEYDKFLKAVSVNEESLVDKNNSINDLSNVKNTISSIAIGTQNWMTEDLSVTQFNNGDIIHEARYAKEWEKLCKDKIPCYYKLKGGKLLYNGYAVADSRGIAPNGYKIPSVNDFEKLFKSLGGGNASDGKATKSLIDYNFTMDVMDMEEIAVKGTNLSKFKATLGGFLYPQGNGEANNTCNFWWTNTSSQAVNSNEKEFFSMDIGYCSNDIGGGKFAYGLDYGFSVRCIKD